MGFDADIKIIEKPIVLSIPFMGFLDSLYTLILTKLILSIPFMGFLYIECEKCHFKNLSIPFMGF